MRDRLAAAAFAALLLATAGCAVPGEGTTRPTRFYVLRSLDPGAAGDAAGPRLEELTAAVGPVELAAYLKRPHVVTLAEGNEVRLADFDRWAEPLEDGISRVLSENLSILLGTERVVVQGPRSLARPAYNVPVKVVRLDGRLEGEVLLSARWGVIERGGEKVLLSRQSIYRVPVDGSGYGPLVAAENRALETLSREIAEALRGFGGRP